MKFLEIYIRHHINVDHIIKLEANELQADNGDFNIEITLSNGEVILDAEVSYQAMMERYDKIIDFINS